MRKHVICLVLCAVVLVSCCGCSKLIPPRSTLPPETTRETEPAVQMDVGATTEPATTPTESAYVYHSGLKEDGSFDAGTWFIGDSMTHILTQTYLAPNGLLGEAKYTAKFGAQITAFFGDAAMGNDNYGKTAYNPEFEGMGYDEVAELLGDSVTAIYMMWGTNYTWNAYADAYIELVDYLLETCPNATIHMQLIPWGYEKKVEFEEVNGWIKEAFDHYQQQGEERVHLIDTFTAIGKNHDSGFIHLNEQGNINWYNAIVEHARSHEES